MDGEQLGAVEEEKDLGVLIHRSFHRRTQIAAAAKKANQVLGSHVPRQDAFYQVVYVSRSLPSPVCRVDIKSVVGIRH